MRGAKVQGRALDVRSMFRFTVKKLPGVLA